MLGKWQAMQKKPKLSSPHNNKNPLKTINKSYKHNRINPTTTTP